MQIDRIVQDCINYAQDNIVVAIAGAVGLLFLLLRHRDLKRSQVQTLLERQENRRQCHHRMKGYALFHLEGEFFH